MNLRASANHLLEDVDRLLHCVQSEGQKCVEKFSYSFEQFHSIVNELVQSQVERRYESSLDALNNLRDNAIDLLERFHILQSDRSNISLSQVIF